MKQLFIPIREKLIIVFLFFCVAPMLIIAYYSYQRTEVILSGSALSHLEVIAKLKAEQIERFYDRARLDLYTLQDSYLLKTGVPTLVAYANNPESAQYTTVKKYIDNRIGNFIKDRDISGVYIFGADKSIIAKAVNDKSVAMKELDEKAFEEGKKGVYFSDIYVDAARSKHFYMTISAPLYDLQQNLLGVVTLETVADYFFDQVQDRNGLGVSGETLIGKKSGNTILFLSGLKYDPTAILSRSVEMGSKVALPIQKASSGVTGSGVSVDYRGAEVFAAWRPIKMVNWGIVAKIDSTEILKPMAEVRRGIAVTGIILLVFGAVASLFLAKILTNPIGNLKKQIQEIKSGNLDYKAIVSSRDEMSILSQDISDIACDMREKAESAEKITHQAEHDQLTGLVNRVVLRDKIARTIAVEKTNGGMFGLLFVDLDGFKPINDNFGHDVGDLLLKEVAVRLGGCVRVNDTVARYGGDEFVLLIDDIKNTDSLSRIAESILEQFVGSFELSGHSIFVGASIGVSVYPKDGDTPERLIKAADEAMYKAKTSGKNHFLYYAQTI